MKRIVTLLFVLSSLNLFAGNGGPDNYGYTWKDSDDPFGPTYNWIDITQNFTATEVKLLGDDNSRGPFSLNFNFHYYWYDVNQFWVGSNGYILFQDGQIASPFPQLPDTLLPNDVLGACMNDLTFLHDNNPAKCWYWINDALDTLIVSWIDVPFFDTNISGYSGSNTFQIIISAVDSSITYQYEIVDPSSPYSGYSSVGMENYSGKDGLHWPNGFITTPPSHFAIKFSYPHPPSSTAVTDAAMIYNDNPSTGAIFLTTNGNPYTLIGEVRNYSTYVVDPFNVQCKVFNPNSQLVINDGTYTDTLESSESQTLTFPSTLTPTIIGSYRWITITTLLNDPLASGNNTKQMEIVAIDSTQDEMWMGYDGGVTSNYTSINWAGGQGGIGDYFKPPFYPVVITKLHYFLSSAGAFSARVFDDDGISGLPFTLLDSIYVPSPISGSWYSVDLPDPIIINDGAFYVSWDMQSTGVSLACLQTLPFSNRCFELFDNIWGIFRFREYQDPMIAVTIEKYSIPTGVNMPNGNSLQLDVFPNPATDEANLLYSMNGNRSQGTIRITDVQGKIINEFNLGIASGTRTMKLDVSKMTSGVYFATLISGKDIVTKKLVIGQ